MPPYVTWVGGLLKTPAAPSSPCEGKPNLRSKGARPYIDNVWRRYDLLLFTFVIIVITVTKLKHEMLEQ